MLGTAFRPLDFIALRKPQSIVRFIISEVMNVTKTYTDAVEALSREVASVGIKTLLVEPGTFRTGFLNPQNMKRVSPKCNDYEELNATVSTDFDQLAGNQVGDPQKGTELVVDVVKGENGTGGRQWPSSLALGSDAVDLIRKRCQETLRELEEWEALSRSTDV